MKEQGYQYTTDLLVIGCGFSGMWAAMRARDFLGDVLVVDKGSGIVLRQMLPGFFIQCSGHGKTAKLLKVCQRLAGDIVHAAGGGGL